MKSKKDTIKSLALHNKDVGSTVVQIGVLSEKINIKELDYFFTNAISRASKTMSECRQIRQKTKKTGTDNL